MRLKRQRLKHIQHLQTSSNLPVGVEPALLKPPRELDRDWTRGGRVVFFFPCSFLYLSKDEPQDVEFGSRGKTCPNWRRENTLNSTKQKK